MKKWWCWIWECVVIVCCCLAVVSNATLIASYWDVSRQAEVLSDRIDELSRVIGELSESTRIIDGRVMAIELNLWRY